MKLKYTPYRGKIEPVKMVHKAEFELLNNFIEVTTFYEYDRFDADTMTAIHDVVKGIDFFNKNNVSIQLEYVIHTADTTEELFPRIKITSGYECTYLWPGEEAFEIYTKLKNWLIK